MSTHSVKAKSRHPEALREQFKVAHLTFELSDTTFALIAGEAVLDKDRRPLFTGVITKGIATELRRLAHHFDEREDKL